MKRRLSLSICLLILSSCSSSESWQVGTISGAQFRIKVPPNWNRSLILFASGYTPEPLQFNREDPPNEFVKRLLTEGYSYAETGYSSGGVAFASDLADIQGLEQHFVQHFGHPDRTFLIGESKGGFLVLNLLENYPDRYAGGLAFSGLRVAPYEFFQDAFDLLVVFQAHFPKILPEPNHVPPDYAANQATLETVVAALERNASASQVLRKHTSAKTNMDLAELVVFHTDALRDLQKRCKGNPFPSHTAAYPDQDSANRLIPRYSADEAAVQCAKQLPVLTGRLTRPFLAVDTQYDPVIPARLGEQYADAIKKSGSASWFVRQVTPDEGHLAVATRLRIESFIALARWANGGAPPQ